MRPPPTMMDGNQVILRRARVDDAERLVQLHYDAVHAGAKGDYPSQVLDAWSPPPDESRYAWMRSQIEAPHHTVVVAETKDAAVIGFCIYTASVGFIHAVYVAPPWAGKGVGRLLLRSAEAGIAGHGTIQVQLNASRNALPFYLGEGYEVVVATTQALADGSWMECHEMRKNLPVAG